VTLRERDSRLPKENPLSVCIGEAPNMDRALGIISMPCACVLEWSVARGREQFKIDPMSYFYEQESDMLIDTAETWLGYFINAYGENSTTVVQNVVDKLTNNYHKK
jgi:hypothetical protein